MKKRKIVFLISAAGFALCLSAAGSRLVQYFTAEAANLEARRYTAAAEPEAGFTGPAPAGTLFPEDCSAEEPFSDTAREAPEAAGSAEAAGPAAPPEESPAEEPAPGTAHEAPETEGREESLPAETSAPDSGDPVFEQLRSIDYAALREINADVVGWILIPGTEVDYPLLQGTDNRFYLEHNWKKEPVSSGSVFLECCCAPDMQDFNTIIYGHRMKNLSMFGSLKYYADPAYLRAHPYIYLCADSRLYRYEVFAVFESPIDALPYRLSVSSPAVKQAVLDNAAEKSCVDTGVVPAADSRILTLSTCTVYSRDRRLVVQAVLRNELPL